MQRTKDHIEITDFPKVLRTSGSSGDNFRSLILKPECNLCLSFYEGVGPLPKFMSVFGGTPIHCEAVLHEEASLSQRFFYTAFMGERFSLNMMTEGMLTRDDVFDTLALKVTQDELHDMQMFFMALVEAKTPYNYTDLPLAAGFAGKGEFLNTMFPDVENHQQPKSVFCSQAIVLCLKRCLNPKNNPGLYEAISKLNSRATSPRRLLQVLEPYCKRTERKSMKDDMLLFI